MSNVGKVFESFRHQARNRDLRARLASEGRIRGEGKRIDQPKPNDRSTRRGILNHRK